MYLGSTRNSKEDMFAYNSKGFMLINKNQKPNSFPPSKTDANWLKNDVVSIEKEFNHHVLFKHNNEIVYKHQNLNQSKNKKWYIFFSNVFNA